jgi:hypothetical protein
LGFISASADAQPETPDREQTFRELSRFFRPEFLNRIDRIIQFRPLSLQVAEQIARREIGLVLERSGIKRRHLVVDIHPEVVSLVVREGYSPHFGARPLKRTVERLLLLPVARAISTGTLKGRTVLKLTLQNGKVSATITGEPQKKELVKEKTSPGFDKSAQLLTELTGLYEALTESIEPLANRKSELMLRTATPDFFRNSDERKSVFEEVHKLDEFLNLYHTVGKGLKWAEGQLTRGPRSKTEFLARLNELESEIEHLSFVSASRTTEDLGDALLTITLVDRQGTPQEAVEKMVVMYQGFAAKRRMTVEILGEFHGERQSTAWLLVSGLGAYFLLKDEAGLHQWDYRFKERTPRAGKEVIRENRELVRVDVLTVPSEIPRNLNREVQFNFSSATSARKRLLPDAEMKVNAFHEKTVRSLQFWAEGSKEQLIEKALTILNAKNQLTVSDGALRRSYDTGLVARVKDLRSGRMTTRVDQVLKGELGPLLTNSSGT